MQASAHVPCSAATSKVVIFFLRAGFRNKWPRFLFRCLSFLSVFPFDPRILGLKPRYFGMSQMRGQKHGMSARTRITIQGPEFLPRWCRDEVGRHNSFGGVLTVAIPHLSSFSFLSAIVVDYGNTQGQREPNPTRGGG
jgi:dolichol kinase